MKRLRTLFVTLLMATILVRPGNGCAFSDEDDPEVHTDPDRPYSNFVAGKLGIVSGDLRIRHLVVAFNNLSGRGLTEAEQRAAIDVDRFYNLGDSYEPQAEADAAADVRKRWDVSSAEHAVPGSDYETFTNCLSDAFAHADATLADLRARYGKPGTPDTPEIQDWIAAQKAVFSNCDGGTSRAFQYPAQAPPPPSRMPQAASASAPLWLRQQRAYQIAAAQFYATQYGAALDSFRAVAADKGSPLAPLARYVIARVLIRQATVAYQPAAGTREEKAKNAAPVRAGLSAARDQLQAILHDPSMSNFYAPAQHLLDYIAIRLDPAAQAEELARRLTQPQARQGEAKINREYRQNVIDLTFAYHSLPAYALLATAASKGPSAAIHPGAPLLRWINDVYAPPSPDSDQSETVDALFHRDPSGHRHDALAVWQQTHDPQWLAAALITAQGKDAAVPDLTAAAKSVAAASPAWATVTYNRLRLASLSRGDRALYDEIAALMPNVEQTQPRSTINQFADLVSASAPTLDLFLKSATRIAAVSTQAEAGEGLPDSPADQVPTPSSSAATLCGVDIESPGTPHLDAQTALILNQRTPLALLQQAALSPVLPANVRFAVAHMAWTRALLLGQSDTALALAPYLAQCQPAFKVWLDQYAAAKSADERHVLGLLALMRFSSTEPTVRVGSERDFAAYSEIRDNWWCDLATELSGTQVPPHLFAQPIVPRELATASAAPPQAGYPYNRLTALPDPPFLTPAHRADVDREIAALQQIPCASDYFARQALAWVGQHPEDAHNADVLGFAMRVVRNACRGDSTGKLNHQLFDTLHQRYPGSEWARRYTTWE